MYQKTQPYIFEFFTKLGYLLLLILPILVPRVCLAAAAPKLDAPQGKVSEPAIEAVILALKDEVYSHGYQTAYSDVGPDKIPIYIDPYVRNNLIWTIYKLMPHGEVFRAAYVRKDGLAVLIGDPFNGFPPTNRAATKTLYMDDEDVIRMKTNWLKRYFSIDLSVSTKEIEEARRRQELRKVESKSSGLNK